MFGRNWKNWNFEKGKVASIKKNLKNIERGSLKGENGGKQF